MNWASSRAVFQKRVRCGCRSTACRMRRTLRGLMASTRPSCTAWRARSALDQWVMCRPRATGSRQANWMIWARWRGGNALGAARTVGVGQGPGGAVSLVTAAVAPDGGRIALPTGGNVVDRFASGDGQDDPRALDLEEGQPGLLCDALEVGAVTRSERNGARFPTAHGAAFR